jgi:hypothetical protein
MLEVQSVWGDSLAWQHWRRHQTGSQQKIRISSHNFVWQSGWKTTTAARHVSPTHRVAASRLSPAEVSLYLACHLIMDFAPK